MNKNTARLATSSPFVMCSLLFVGMGYLFLTNIEYHILPIGFWIQKPFHSFLEATGALVAIILAILLFRNETQVSIKTHILWVSCALICMGVLDGIHSLVEPGESFVWLHSVATFSGGLLFAMVWLP